MKVPWAVRLIWANLPDARCKGLCADYCGPIAASPVEAAILADAGLDVPDTDDMSGMLEHIADALDGANATCPALRDGRCTVYAVRPAVCRLWGAIERLPCPHGCVPVGGRMDNETAGRVLSALDATPVPVAVRRGAAR